ncbi:hypothetical protein A2661_00855 [Candidatus Giovannonibacteria bacterium RIFCSPHIGHO2_01_FULL_45_24]|uniref:Restriction endonuclease type II DpnII-like domain-containing protein n=1 Tax=Candidatus Giovannonibacteria bacterium RIFCSPLOWO2_01_FULL_46_32 TaxID=1798353 RepID=A0A1F5XF96_9BACT|nr:MAG: hypothetical protein A2661_00855 [Candidatus Giovannonibacteria bacterium RIFCSPHIGHO2_01_FULL_45_24]OGF86614.1 MAG: hypothetical protein A3B19_00180 [Candidatus Giovannonibacteria bacterium RIFCSPLOWO2_01_FULL_46_32]
MINNIKLFKFSLNNPEPIIDEFYLKNGNLIISKDPKNPTDLMRKNFDLLESISAYNFAKKNKNQLTARKAIEKILEIVKNKNINYSEFVSFWPVVDISYSLFKNLNGTEQIKIIKNIVEKYINLRHNLYSTYGYTPTTLQVGKDAKAHKESGNLGTYKVSKILDITGFKKANVETIADFNKGDKKYIEADKKGKKLFKKLLNYYKINFSWSKKREQKIPDFLIRYKDGIFIVEHKHMKEGGGGQDKQVNEVISFVSFSESNNKIHYISFLDGIYFNLFTNTKYLNKGKILNQLNNIKQKLKRNKQNYFVNTAGFKKLLKSLNRV